MTAYSPLGSPDRPFVDKDAPVVLDNPLLQKIADKHKTTIALVSCTVFIYFMDFSQPSIRFSNFYSVSTLTDASVKMERDQLRRAKRDLLGTFTIRRRDIRRSSSLYRDYSYPFTSSKVGDPPPPHPLELSRRIPIQVQKEK